MSNIQSSSKKTMSLAADLLRQGKLVALPTETVYGLAADASNISALQSLFKLKKRPPNKALSVHIRKCDIEQWAQEIPETAWQLMAAFWPGPLTLILKKQPEVNSIISGGQENIGLRCPDHPVFQAILDVFQGGLAAPSANQSAHLSPTTAQHVYDELGDELPLIVDAGACPLGMESTIIDLSQTKPCLLRQGIIRTKEIELTINQEIKDISEIKTLKTNTPIKHLETIDLETLEQPDPTDQGITAIVSQQPKPNQLPRHIHWHHMPQDPKQYAAVYYQVLRELDQQEFKLIIVCKTD